MIETMWGRLVKLSAATALLASSAAWAQDDQPGQGLSTTQDASHHRGPTLTTSAALVSDYRDRGISFSSTRPAVQGSAELGFDSGWFIGTWASSISNYGGSHAEVDFYGGYAGSTAGIDYSASLLVYYYPGGRDVDIFELQTTVRKTLGPVSATLMLAYTPEQWNTDIENYYAGLTADAAIVGTPITASAGIGYEDGFYTRKWDWKAGLTYKLDALEISAFYVDTNYKGATEEGKNGSAAAILSVKANF